MASLESAATISDVASVPIAVPHRSHQIARAFGLRRHGRRQRLEQGRIDPLARLGDGGEPRDRLAAPGDVDRVPRLDPVDELAQMCLGVRQINRVDATLLTM